MSGPALGRVIAASGAGAVIGATVTRADSSFWSDIVAPMLPAALEFLKSAPKEATMTAAEVHALALKASVEAFSALLKAQQSARTPLWKLALFLGIPAAACGYALHQVGWANVGWVTPVKFEVGMARVVEQVSSRIVDLGDMLHFRFTETAKAVQEVKEELSSEIREVGESVQRIETRLEPMETDARRSAQGVVVLCDLVASSGLLSNASASSLRRLDDFTRAGEEGGGHQPLADGGSSVARPPLPAPAATAEAPTTFLRAIMAEPPIMAQP